MAFPDRPERLMRVLVVEDEKRLARSLRVGLEAEGLAVDLAHDGTDGLWLARENEYDAIVLDLMLPGINGYKVCQTLRTERNWTPILMLTAKDGEWDQVEGLDTGADDYLTKPFSFPVLVARLRAVSRRGARERPTQLEAGDLRLDPAARRAWRGGVEADHSGVLPARLPGPSPR
jgi:DNA-binding response OmpR family regulator